MLSNLQAVRALAAIGVVVLHIGLMPPTSFAFQVGASGVDLFFMRSRFIIAHGSRHFLPRRLIRVVPAYWSATLILEGVGEMLQSAGVELVTATRRLRFVGNEKPASEA